MTLPPLVRHLAGLALLVCALVGTPALAQEPYFETGPLNTGLDETPATLDRSTPQGTMESFLALAETGRFTDAAHLLDLSGIPEVEQPVKGALLASQLFVVMDRKTVIPWESLADRPDGWVMGSKDDPSAGRERRSITLDVLTLDKSNVTIRLNRIKPAGADPVWVIASQSVDNIPALFELYGPSRLEKALPDWARKDTGWGLYVWEIVFLPLMLLGATLLGVATYRIIGAFQNRRDTALVRAIVRALRWPGTIAVTTAFVGQLSSQLFVVSGVLDTLISPAVFIGFIAAMTLAVVLIIDEIFDHISKSNPHELAEPENIHLRNMATGVSAARKFVIVIAVLVAIGLVLTSANVFRTLGLSFLASAGAVTLIFGFAAREVLGNIMASVQIALNGSARIGDQLIFEGHFCTVERIHFTYVQLLTWNGNRYIVPVSYFVSDAFENWSIGDTKMIRPITLTLAQSADVGPLRDFFLKRIEEENGDETGPVEKAKVHVIEQDVFGKKVRFELPTPNPSTNWEMECEMREALLAEAARLQRDKGKPVLPPDNVQDLPDP